MDKPITPTSALIQPDALGDIFRARFPKATEQEIAGVMAKFLEEVPANAVTDDGVLSSQVDDDWKAGLQLWIDELKAFAGDAYPPGDLHELQEPRRSRRR